MKKKFLIVMLAFISIVMCLFGIAGCNLSPQDNIDNTDTSDTEIVTPKPDEDKHTHSLTYHKPNDATCTQNGNIEYWECSNCGKYFSDDKGQNEIAENQLTIEKRGHVLISHEGKTATCNSIGWEEYETCENCDFTTYQEITAIDHAYVHHICKYCNEVDPNVKPTEGLELTLFTEEDGSSAYAITGIGTATDEDIVFPANYKGLPVTKIGEQAFSQNKSIKSVLFSENIKLIDRAAFDHCEYLEIVCFNDRLQKIDNVSFRACCRIVNLTIPNSVSFIGINTFAGCNNLKTIILSNHLEYIGTTAFARTAFYDDKTNWENGLLYIDKYLLAAKISELSGDIKIKEGVDLIACNVFQNCTATNILIPNTVKHINGNSFVDCTSNIIWGDSPQINEIGAAAFQSLKNENKFVIPDSVTKIDLAAFSGSYISSVEIPSSVKSIGERAFYGSRIEKIKFNEGLVTVGDEAFKSCSRLSEVVLPNSLKAIPEYCFQECGNLTTINLGNQLKEIGKCAFQDCDKLSYIKIPASVEFIGMWAFYEGIGGFILKNAVFENKNGWKVVNHYDSTKIKYLTYSDLSDPVSALRTYNNYDWYRT